MGRGVIQILASKCTIKLEISKQDSERFASGNEYSLKEAGRDGENWVLDKLIDTIFWSDAIHEIYGTDPKRILKLL
jgi:hypothetical protein